MLGLEPKLSDSQSKNLGNILQVTTENFGLQRSNVQCKRHNYYVHTMYVLLYSFLPINKAKNSLGMLCRDKSIIALIIGQYMKYIDLFNRAIIDTYSPETVRSVLRVTYTMAG